MIDQIKNKAQHWDIEDRISGTIDPFYGTLDQLFIYLIHEAKYSIGGLTVYNPEKDNEFVVIITKLGSFILRESYRAS